MNTNSIGTASRIKDALQAVDSGPAPPSPICPDWSWVGQALTQHLTEADTCPAVYAGKEEARTTYLPCQAYKLGTPDVSRMIFTHRTSRDRTEISIRNEWKPALETKLLEPRGMKNPFRLKCQEMLPGDLGCNEVGISVPPRHGHRVEGLSSLMSLPSGRSGSFLPCTPGPSTHLSWYHSTTVQSSISLVGHWTPSGFGVCLNWRLQSAWHVLASIKNTCWVKAQVHPRSGSLARLLSESLRCSTEVPEFQGCRAKFNKGAFQRHPGGLLCAGPAGRGAEGTQTHGLCLVPWVSELVQANTQLLTAHRIAVCALSFQTMFFKLKSKGNENERVFFPS